MMCFAVQLRLAVLNSELEIRGHPLDGTLMVLMDQTLLLIVKLF